MKEDYDYCFDETLIPCHTCGEIDMADNLCTCRDCYKCCNKKIKEELEENEKQPHINNFRHKKNPQISPGAFSIPFPFS